MLRVFLGVMCVIGTIWPWYYFGAFFWQYGPNFSLFVEQMTPTAVAKGLTTDISLSILVFWVGSFLDARSQAVRNWWLVLPATVCVGFSLALPLYLLLRENRLSASN